MKRLNIKGFSVVEVVIALAVISIVTITAISISSLSTSNTQVFLNKADAQYLVADAIECFKATPCSSADDYEDFCDEFYQAFEFRGGLTSASNNESDDRLYMINKSGYIVTVTIDDTFLYDRKKIKINIIVTDPINNNKTVIQSDDYWKSVYEDNQ